VPPVAAGEIAGDGVLSGAAVSLGGIAEKIEQLVETEKLLRHAAKVALVTRQNRPLTDLSIPPV
jgi:hypothetical protein